MAEKIYFKIGDIAAKYDVNTSLVRYWEQQFSVIKPQKNNKGTRYYTKQDFDNFGLIYHLIKEKGMTIKGACEYIEKKKNDEGLEKVQVISTLKRTKDLLEDVRSILSEKTNEK